MPPAPQWKVAGGSVSYVWPLVNFYEPPDVFNGAAYHYNSVNQSNVSDKDAISLQLSCEGKSLYPITSCQKKVGSLVKMPVWPSLRVFDGLGLCHQFWKCAPWWTMVVTGLHSYVLFYKKGCNSGFRSKNNTTCTKSGKGYRGAWAGVRRCHHTPHMSPLPVTFSKSLKFGKSN